MNVFKVILLTVVSILLLVQIVGEHHQPEQRKALKDSLDQTRAQLQRLQTTVEGLQRTQSDLLDQQDELGAALVASNEAMRVHREGFLQGLQIALSRGPASADAINVIAPVGPDAQGTNGEEQIVVPQGQIDGVPKLGEDFLLDLDESSYQRRLSGGIRRRFGSEPSEGLNPLTTSMGATSDVASMVNDDLCSKGVLNGFEDRWYQGLATSCIIEDDYKTYTFSIRKGVRWQVPQIAISDPETYGWLAEPAELTAHDFVFYLDMVMDPNVQASHLRVYYEELESWEALDDYTLRITWKKKLYTNIDFTLGLSPMPRHVYAHNADGSPIERELLGVVMNDHWFDEAFQTIGVGRYVLEEYKRGEFLRFRTDPNYWGVPEHYAGQRWDIKTKAPDAQLTAFKNNEVHASALTPTQYKAEVLDGAETRFASAEQRRDGVFGWEQVEGNRWAGVVWNMRKPQLRDRAVRQALAHAYPFERIHKEVLFGLGRQSIGPIHPTSPYFNQAMAPFDFDLERAAALLDEAGWTDSDGDGWRDKLIEGTRVPLRVGIVYYAPIRTYANVVALYAEQCRSVGIELVGEPVGDNEWAARAQNRDFDGFMVVWRSGLEVDFKQLWHGEGADDPDSSNYAGYANAELDPLIDELREVFDPAERQAIAKTIQAGIYTDQPYLFLWVPQSILVWHNAQAENGASRELIGGLEYGFENYHPLLRTDDSRWHIVEP